MGVHVVVFCLSCVVAWSLNLCDGAPTLKPNLAVVAGAPHEQCFDQTCNRVTHYCDKVIRSCASCEDDCHPSRITDDEQAIQECQRICDWYYYIKSLNERNELSHVEESEHRPTEDHGNVAVHKYYITVIVLVGCFTVIVVFILAMFACYIKRQSTRPLVVSQETIGSSNINIYKPYNLEKTPSLIDTKNNSNETSLKLLTDYDNPSLEVRTGQQESIRQSLTNRSVICHSGGGPSQTRSGKLHSAQVHGNNASLPRSHEDLSTQRLVK